MMDQSDEKQEEGANIKLDISDKFWEDLTYEERVERMMNVIEKQARTIRSQGSIISELIIHKHDDRGNIYIPKNIGEDNYSLSQQSPFKKRNNTKIFSFGVKEVRY